jgi:hypothetical protein
MAAGAAEATNEKNVAVPADVAADATQHNNKNWGARAIVLSDLTLLA